MNVWIRRATCALVTLAFAGLQIPAVAGTTGSITGVVTQAGTSTPVAGAKVTVTSPSQIETTQTDAAGRFGFVSLAPDEYTVSVEKTGYESLAQPGVSVFADTPQSLSLQLRPALKTIANVSSRASGDLVRPGTTSDLYSINAAQQARTSVLGGGGNLNSAYSAVASVPGAYVPANQSGYGQAIHVRGGDSDQVGVEFDGVPVNRSFDNYASGSLSSLGQLELQVYTGATPSNAEAQGLAGFINQVIKTGTRPGYGVGDLALGTPTFYHSFDVETGGATPDRLFSYYVGIGGFNQDHRYVAQDNGASVQNELGAPLDVCPAPPLAASAPPSCFTNGQANVGQAGAPGYILGPLQFASVNPAGIATRTTVLNFHIGIPHKHDGGRDDVQLLYDNDEIFTSYYSSAQDEGLNNFQGQTYGPGVLPYYTDSYQYHGPVGQFFAPGDGSQVGAYFFPSSPTQRVFNATIPITQRDTGYNGQAIVKVQYQKNFGSQAYFRVYGYTYYSNYIGTGPISSWQPITGYDSGDYELSSHTRGISASFNDQINAQNLLELQASYVTATSLRMNNTQMFNNADSFAVLVNPHDLTSGTCYTAPTTATGAAAPTSCNPGNWGTSPATSATFLSLAANYTCNTTPGCNPATVNPNAASYTCGGVTCAFYTVENGAWAEYNAVKPVFTGYSITDQFKPNDKLNVDVGLRLDSYQFTGANTNYGAARNFWFAAFNGGTCFNTQTQQLQDKTQLGLIGPAGNQPCSSAGGPWVATNMQNVSGQQYTYNVLQPRVGATYVLNPETVLRASYGRYNEQPSAAYEQYNSLQQNLPADLAQFYSLGFTTPGHGVAPSISNNYDFSIEQRLKGTNWSYKLTPFYRQTQDQVENFYTNIKEGFISGLNAGKQTSEGFEFALQKGDFARNGIAGQLSFAYTNSYVNYAVLPNGTTILSPINGDIQTYNAFTSFCATHAKDARCGGGVAPVDPNTNAAIVAAPCYSAAGAPVSCTASGAVANPYWNAPVQPLLNPAANYIPYSTFPGGIGTGVNGFNYPYVATLILNYKHDKWAVTPSFQFQAGNRYGAPETMPGVDPLAGCSALGGSVAGDPRYRYGAAGGSPYDATTCAGQLNAIPNSYTGQFDGIGAFRQPAQFLGHLRIEYQVSNKLTVDLTLANLIQTCFGAQQTPFTYMLGSQICSYSSVGNGLTSPVGNVYNPHDNVQTYLRYPYEPNFGTYNDLAGSLNQPFNAYISMKVKI